MVTNLCHVCMSDFVLTAGIFNSGMNKVITHTKADQGCNEEIFFLTENFVPYGQSFLT